MNTQRHLTASGETQQSRVLRWTLGIALSFVAGVAFWWIPSLMGYADILDDATTGYLVLGVTIALAFASGAVLRSNWSFLVIPAAWVVGDGLARLIASIGTADVNWAGLLPLSGGILLLVGLPLMASAGLGVLFGRWLARRGEAHRASTSPPLTA